MKFSISSLLAFLALVALSNEQAFAKNWPSVGWFDITEFENGCAATAEYSFDGRSDVKLALIISEGDYPVLMVNSLDWSAKDGVEYPGITYGLNGFVYSDIKDDDGKTIVATKGSTLDRIYKGFVRAFPKDFLDDFAKGSSLIIEKGDVVITHVNLQSSGAAVAKLRECAAYVKRQNDAQRKKEEQWEYIDKDPFATANTQIAANKPATPQGNAGAWISTSDYPSRALSEGRGGTVQFKVIVGTDGRVAKCEITKSSGHADLDQATCSNITRRARFSPATNQTAQPTEGVWSSKMTWQIPGDISVQDATADNPL